MFPFPMVLQVPQNPRMALAAAGASAIVVGVLLVIKTAAFAMTGSATVLASLVDSVMDAAVSAMNFAAIRLSLKPADDEHRFGHGKAEGLAAMVQAALICGSAAFLGLESVSRLAEGRVIEIDGIAIVLMAAATILSLALVAFQNYVLRYAPSLAVESDKAHYASDIVMNGAVIIALLFQLRGAPGWLDPVIALAVAAWMGWTAISVGLRGMNMLMDRELPDDVREEIQEIVRNHPDVLNFHDLRTRATGMAIDISLDIEVAPDMTLKEAHGIAKSVEKNLLKVYTNAEIMIHVDPAGETADSRHGDLGITQK